MASIVRVYKAVVALHAGISEYTARIQAHYPDDFTDALSLSPADDWLPHLRVLSSEVREHINPPAALGSGHRSLMDKASAEVYKWALQTPAGASMETQASSYIAHTSDMGVEIGLPDVQFDGPVHSLLPA